MQMRAFNSSRRALAIGATAAVIAGSAYVLAQEANQTNDNGLHGGDSYAIALFGDMPYNALGRAQYPNLLTDINASHVAFSVFDGDLKAGGDGPCADNLYTTAIDNFNTLKQPLVWLPGDNDWTDCWGRYGASTQPYFDPIERLNFERQLFVSTDQSLGQKTLTLTRQASAGYPEHVRWKFGPVVYIGLNVRVRTTTIPTRASMARRVRTRRSRVSAPKRSHAKRRFSTGCIRALPTPGPSMPKA
jgi:hypothetical protein